MIPIPPIVLVTLFAAGVIYGVVKVRQDIVEHRVGLAALGSIGTIGALFMLCLFGYVVFNRGAVW